MNFELNEEQRIFFDSVNRFAHQELADGALSRSRSEKFPFDVAARFAEMQLLGLTIAESDGGMGGSLMDAILAILAVADACPRSADVIQAGNFGAIRTFAEYGTAEQKKRFLPALLAGKAVMAVAMTEPEAGSAVTELATTAVQDANGCTVNGSKIFGTHSSEADVFLVYVRYGPGLAGIGSVLVERDTPGFSIGPPSKFMNGETWSELHFDDCRIPGENILLGAGGFKKQLAGFNVERLGNAARSLAVGQHAFNVAREHALTRHQFGRPLCEFQGLQWKFAEMKLGLEAAYLLLMRAVTKSEEGLPAAQDTALAKLACNEAGFNAANESLQVMGGYGFSEESIVQYCVRRTRGWMIAGGSTEILKNRVAEGIFERKFPQRRETL